MVRSVISLGWVIEGPIKACLRSRKVRKVIKAFTERETVLVPFRISRGRRQTVTFVFPAAIASSSGGFCLLPHAFMQLVSDHY